MALPTIYWFSKVREVLEKVFPFVTSGLALLAWWYNIVAVALVGALHWIRNALNALDLSAFAPADFSAWPYIGVINAIFPLTESLALLGAYFTVWIAVIVVRWVKSFIPTLAN